MFFSNIPNERIVNQGKRNQAIMLIQRSLLQPRETISNDRTININLFEILNYRNSFSKLIVLRYVRC